MSRSTEMGMYSTSNFFGLTRTMVEEMDSKLVNKTRKKNFKIIQSIFQ